MNNRKVIGAEAYGHLCTAIDLAIDYINFNRNTDEENESNKQANACMGDIRELHQMFAVADSTPENPCDVDLQEFITVVFHHAREGATLH